MVFAGTAWEVAFMQAFVVLTLGGVLRWALLSWLGSGPSTPADPDWPSLLLVVQLGGGLVALALLMVTGITELGLVEAVGALLFAPIIGLAGLVMLYGGLAECADRIRIRRRDG